VMDSLQLAAEQVSFVHVDLNINVVVPRKIRARLKRRH